ncbi:hypothetical protein FB451DRAFT_1186512 [Mycena latifolia]|nr:hypothetical protein FB451DRAFT_1186512 [Mycena latifolia]
MKPSRKITARRAVKKVTATVWPIFQRNIRPFQDGLLTGGSSTSQDHLGVYWGINIARRISLEAETNCEHFAKTVLHQTFDRQLDLVQAETGGYSMGTPVFAGVTAARTLPYRLESRGFDPTSNGRVKIQGSATSYNPAQLPALSGRQSYATRFIQRVISIFDCINVGIPSPSLAVIAAANWHIKATDIMTTK